MEWMPFGDGMARVFVAERCEDAVVEWVRLAMEWREEVKLSGSQTCRSFGHSTEDLPSAVLLSRRHQLQHLM